jgi:superfamily II DNA or RNA helicase
MNPIETTQRLQETLVDYLTTTFDVNKNGKEEALARKIREGFEKPEALFSGPYLEMILPYKTGISLEEFCNEGVLSAKIKDLPSFNKPNPEPIPLNSPLYTHQVKAIRKLSGEQRSIVVSSGTGSGKTECFSIPIISDLLKDNTPGVRALLIYPLNALVNDQLSRLRVLLNGTKITFGRFTSELPDSVERTEGVLPNEVISRDEIRVEGKIPQILITNYAMLEYLLLRPEDSVLFEKGLWKFLVLDEAHTYSGAKGIEVSMLIRRLKQRLNKRQGEMQCIGTSATLGKDDATSAAKFASNLFGENVTEDDVIFGEENTDYFKTFNVTETYTVEPTTYIHQGFPSLLDELRLPEPDIEKVALLLGEIGLIPDQLMNLAEQYKHDASAFLFKALTNNIDIINLRSHLIEIRKPLKFTDAAKLIFPYLESDDQLSALYHLVELGTLARPNPSMLPLIPAKYHLFARAPQGLWACINPDCPGKENSDQNWSRIYTTPHITCEFCEAMVFQVTLCRDCGQVFLVADYSVNTSELEPATEETPEGYQKRYYTWSPIEENVALSEEESLEDDEDLPETEHKKFVQTKVRVCVNCGNIANNCRCQNDRKICDVFDIQESEVRQRKGRAENRIKPVNVLDTCPRCGNKSKKDTETATPVTIMGTAPLANLVYELYRGLPPSTNPVNLRFPGEGRKLLTFYDSRQGAARFAAYLQDIANKQNYRHLIPIVLDQIIKGDEWSKGFEPTWKKLSQECAAAAWQHRIIENDTESDYWHNTANFYTEEIRSNTSILLARHILSEFTTGRNSRQSLEQMGLAGINYQINQDSIGIGELSGSIGLSIEQTITLISYFLDEFRYSKVIELPRNIAPDDPIFGLNKWQPRLIRQGNINTGQNRFIGETNRHSRRKYVKQVLDSNSIDSSDENVKNVLTKLWDWMVGEGEILSGTPIEGYRLKLDRVLFSTQFNWFRCDKCQRLSYRGSSLPCPRARCGGTLKPIDIDQTQANNFYYNLFKKDLIPVRVEEHTAQLDPEKGQEYQEYFNKGRINILSCSTTFELGIDLGDLQVVGMSNVPPTVANYRQRAGRAGRRSSGSAFILTWAPDRPHDQAYYDNPIEIISGEVSIPNLVLYNEFIMQRHLNALLLSNFLRYRHQCGSEFKQLKYCSDFFDTEMGITPHIKYINQWIDSNRNSINKALSDYADLLGIEQENIKANSLTAFQISLNTLNDEHYQPVTKYYRDQIKNISTQVGNANLAPATSDKFMSQLNYFRGLLDRMRGNKNYGSLIDYLSSKGVLPSYSFPLNTVELILPKKFRDSDHLRLERDLKQAIREYAPGSEIVADKRIWRSEKPIFWKNVAKDFQYRICEHCHNLELSEEAGIPLSDNEGTCEICGQAQTGKSKVRDFVEPDGFLADSSSGTPARQYVNIEPSQMRSALLPEHTADEEFHNDHYKLSYDRKGKLLYVNEGKYGKGFRFSIEGFGFFDETQNNEVYSLGHIQTTDTLHIRFVGNEYLPVPSPREDTFWFSLMYALIHGASHALQIERGDIDGVLSPRKTDNAWEQTIVLYDNVPGGAGHVKTIQDNFEKVLYETHRILNCNDCAPDTSCNHCLRDYNNQFYYPYLKRDAALKFLDGLMSQINPIHPEIPGVFKVNAPNLSDWLFEKIRYAKERVDIAIESLDDYLFESSENAWLDLMNEIILKGKNVDLYLKSLPDSSPKGLSQARHLQVLIGKGLILSIMPEIPQWRVIIDKNYPESRAIALIKEETIDKIGEVLTTTHSDGVHIVVDKLAKLSKTRIKTNQLDPPPNTIVKNIHASTDAGATEERIFSSIFLKPIKKIVVNDPYLNDYEKIINRLGAYIKLASQHGTLEEVDVYTKKYFDEGQQQRAEDQLIKQYGSIMKIKHVATHDRCVEITRVNGEKARILIGVGLDFIQPNGTVRDTYIVIQDPLNSN